MDTALALAGPAYCAARTCGRRRPRGDGRRRLVDRRRRVSRTPCPRLGCLVPSQRWQRRDLVRLVGLQGCLQELRTPSTGGRRLCRSPVADPLVGVGSREAVRRRRGTRRRRPARAARPGRRGSSGRTDRARRRCCTRSPGSHGSTAGSRVSRGHRQAVGMPAPGWHSCPTSRRGSTSSPSPSSSRWCTPSGVRGRRRGVARHCCSRRSGWQHGQMIVSVRCRAGCGGRPRLWLRSRSRRRSCSSTRRLRRSTQKRSWCCVKQSRRSRGAGRACSSRPRISTSRRARATTSCCSSAGTSWSAARPRSCFGGTARRRSKVSFSPQSATPACVSGFGTACVLCSAVLRCQARRLLALGRSAPLLSAAAVIAVAAAPWPLARAGAELGRALGPALGGAVGGAGARRRPGTRRGCSGGGPCRVLPGPARARPATRRRAGRQLRRTSRSHPCPHCRRPPARAAERARLHAAVRGADARWSGFRWRARSRRCRREHRWSGPRRGAPCMRAGAGVWERSLLPWWFLPGLRSAPGWVRRRSARWHSSRVPSPEQSRLSSRSHPRL